mmetsp:Transcript_2548/g.5869  ORF Transcript_2548/g.5869 Transcript_2548/m.5869 type:complete len:286 (-) Transcript_2548:12-869(-)
MPTCWEERWLAVAFLVPPPASKRQASRKPACTNPPPTPLVPAMAPRRSPRPPSSLPPIPVPSSCSTASATYARGASSSCWTTIPARPIRAAICAWRRCRAGWAPCSWRGWTSGPGGRCCAVLVPEILEVEINSKASWCADRIGPGPTPRRRSRWDGPWASPSVRWRSWRGSSPPSCAICATDGCPAIASGCSGNGTSAACGTTGGIRASSTTPCWAGREVRAAKIHWLIPIHHHPKVQTMRMTQRRLPKTFKRAIGCALRRRNRWWFTMRKPFLTACASADAPAW